MIKWMCVLLVSAVSHLAHGKLLAEKDLESFDIAIFLDPKNAYAGLTTQLKEESNQEPVNTWLLLRKAQAENILGMYDKVSQTLTSLSRRRSAMSELQVITLDYLRGIMAHKDSRLDDSVKLLNSAMNQASAMTMSTVYALIVRELGYVYALKGEYYRANLVLHSAYKSFVSLNNPFFNGLIEESLGDTYNYSGNYQDSVRYYNGALGFFEELQYKPFIASTLLGLATVNRRLGKWDEALELFDRYDTALRFTDNFSDKFYLQYGRAMTLAEKGDCEKAFVAINVALAMNGLKDYNAELFKKEAICHLENNDIDSAKQSLSMAKTILDGYDELKGTQWYLELDYIQSLIAASQNDLATALSLTQQYYQDYLNLQQTKNADRIGQMQKTLESERKDQEIALLKRTSQLREVEASAQTLRVQQQRFYLVAIVSAALFLLAFIGFQYRHSRKLFYLSTHDELTGLHNRRYFFDFIDKTSNKHSFSSMAIIYFDIDDFKRINDSLGHNSGDRLIVQTARTAAGVIRSDDLICRVGGDEFLIVLPDTGLEKAEHIARRLLLETSNNVVQFEHQNPVSVTLSAGIAYRENTPTSRFDVDRLIDAADKALYQSKRDGKNRYTIA